MTLESLPILDISQLDAGGDVAEAFRTQLRETTHEVGFFYLVGHGIPQQLIDEVLDVSRKFFALPEHDKLAIENVHSPQFRGYTRTGKELTNGEVDWREQIDIGEERGTRDGAEDYWRLEGPNLWPVGLPELETAFTEWRTQLSALALRLMRTWAVALGSPENVFDDAFAADRAFSLIKVVRYPGPSEEGVAQQGHQPG